MSSTRRIAAASLAALLLACADDRGAEAGGGESDTRAESESGDSGEGDGDSGDGDGEGDGDSGEGDGDSGEGDGDTGGGPLDDLLTLDHIQVKATHNSYHLEPALPFDASHEYSHPPLDEQLDSFGVRAFELDLHLGGGDVLEVYHIAVIDEVSTCDTLVDCLSTIKGWSDQHPGHVPIMVWFELKDSTGGGPIDDLLVVDQTILEVFPMRRIVTPDFVQGDHESVRAALESEGWPTLGEVRGKIMFMVLNGGHASVEAYTYGHTSLLGRAMFVSGTDTDQPWTAVAKNNNPAAAAIPAAHGARILVASNICGAGQDEAECFTELEAGKQNGVHNLKDDFLSPVEGMRYFLDLPDGNPARCNGVTAPPECTPEAVEDLP